MDKKLKKWFLKYRDKFWSDSLFLIDIKSSRIINCCGEYHYPSNEQEDEIDSYRIVISSLYREEFQRKTLLHEMCHHYVFINNKDLVWNKKIKMHGKLWREEMRRVGFTGRIRKET